MSMKSINASVTGRTNVFAALKQAIQGGSIDNVTGNESFSDFTNSLNSIQGVEAMEVQDILKDNVGQQNYTAVMGALGRRNTPHKEMQALQDAYAGAEGVSGMEGFSLQNFEGNEVEIKAANTTLNAQAHQQTEAAEAMFPTVTVKYEDEGINLKVRAAGIGSYVYGASAWQSASELRPIFGLLRSGEMFKDEVLALHPVFPADDQSPNRALFADNAFVAPVGATYPEGDAYGRTAHQTQYLKVPSTIPNLLALCEVPGQRPWTSTDEIESNSIVVESVGVKATLGTDPVNFFVNTVAMSNNGFGPTTASQSSDDRGLNMHIRNLPGFSVRDNAGAEVGRTLFADFLTAGYEPLLTISLNGNYQRQSNELRLSSGTAEIAALRHISSGRTITIGRADTAELALLRLLTDGSVAAVNVSLNVSNTSRGNFGYRIEVYDAHKHLSVRRGSPVSVKYPVSKDDVNQDSLDFAISQMAVVLNNYRSRQAFKVAQDHIDYITSIDGAPVVANDQGSNVLAGQHFVTASSVNRSVTLADVVSSQDSMDVFENVTATIANEMSDIISALNTKSGLSAVAEYGAAAPTKWVAIAHQNLHRFLMRKSEARTAGIDLPIEAIETNFDSQVGQIIIVPKSDSSSDNINPLSGVGVCVSKENVLIQGNVSRDQQDFGIILSQPTFKHWALCPIIGTLTISDAEDMLGDEGLLTKLAKQKMMLVNQNGNYAP